MRPGSTGRPVGGTTRPQADTWTTVATTATAVLRHQVAARAMTTEGIVEGGGRIDDRRAPLRPYDDRRPPAYDPPPRSADYRAPGTYCGTLLLTNY